MARPATQVKEVLQQLRSECIITYDPKIRRALLGTHAETRRSFEELVHLANVVKLSDEDAEWLYPGRTPVTDTIGAGDSYMSALILGLLTQATGGLAASVLDRLGGMAAAAAAITVSRAGARPPTDDELRAKLQPPLHSHS